MGRMGATRRSSAPPANGRVTVEADMTYDDTLDGHDQGCVVVALVEAVEAQGRP